MADAQAPASIKTLPPELLERVFDFLSCDHSHVDIANSRLVSKRFHALSSQFLISTVVIANRQATLQHLREVLEHPYFSKHVTRLIWDASEYDWRVATELSKYQRQCDLKPWSSSTIAAYCDSLGMDVAELARLQDNWSKALRLGGATRRRTAGLALSQFSSDNEDASDSADQKMRELVYLAHRDYGKRYNDQADIRLESTLKLLQTAFEKLPKLRHFEFSDFRALGRSGETLRELCDRLFGQTLSPDLLPDDEQGHMYYEQPSAGLRECLRRLAEIRPSLQSLSFGRSDFSDWDSLQCNASPRMIMSDMHMENEEYWRPLLGCIRHLSLPVEISFLEGAMGPCWAPASTRRLLSDSAASLTHLNLEVGLYSGLTRDSWDDRAEAKPVFAKILGQIHFSSLESVVLRGWLFSLTDLETFLLAHATTLRNVHLINCCLAEASKDELITSIKSKLEPALALTGVEIYALMYESRCLERHLYKARQRVSHRQKLLDEGDDALNEASPIPRDQDRLDRSDLENLFLRGRRNAVTRVERKNADWKARKLWWRDLDDDDSDDEPDDPASPLSPDPSQDSEDSDGYQCQGFLGAFYD
jgi:hypothetical protein